MNPISKIITALWSVANHPVNRNRRLKAALKYGIVQLAARMVPGDICVEFPNGSLLVVSPRMKGAAHYIEPRLFELEDMSFVTHFLRPGDSFVDVGANVGAFTILASAVAGANTVAFEPSPATYRMLHRNVLINDLSTRVKDINAAVGSAPGTVEMTVGLGTENRMTVSAEQKGQTESVRVTTLDQELKGPVTALKVDVEGFETAVFVGGRNTLASPSLEAIIIEKDGQGERFGFDEEALHASIRDAGFIACEYSPFERRLVRLNQVRSNIIYVRDLELAEARLRAAPEFVLGSLKL